MHCYLQLSFKLHCSYWFGATVVTLWRGLLENLTKWVVSVGCTCNLKSLTIHCNGSIISHPRFLHVLTHSCFDLVLPFQITRFWGCLQLTGVKERDILYTRGSLLVFFLGPAYGWATSKSENLSKNGWRKLNLTFQWHRSVWLHTTTKLKIIRTNIIFFVNINFIFLLWWSIPINCMCFL